MFKGCFKKAGKNIFLIKQQWQTFLPKILKVLAHW